MTQEQFNALKVGDVLVNCYGEVKRITGLDDSTSGYRLAFHDKNASNVFTAITNLAIDSDPYSPTQWRIH